MKINQVHFGKSIIVFLLAIVVTACTEPEKKTELDIWGKWKVVRVKMESDRGRGSDGEGMEMEFIRPNIFIGSSPEETKKSTFYIRDSVIYGTDEKGMQGTMQIRSLTKEKLIVATEADSVTILFMLVKKEN